MRAPGTIDHCRPVTSPKRPSQPLLNNSPKGSGLVQRPDGRKHGLAPLQPDTPVIENSPAGRVLSADNEDARAKARLQEATQPPDESAVVHPGGKVKGEDPEQLTVGLGRRDELAPD